MAQTPPIPVKTLFFHIMKGNFSGAQKNIFRLLRRIDQSKLVPVLMGQAESNLTKFVRKEGIEVVIMPFPESLEVYDQKLLKFNIGQMIQTFLGVWKYNSDLVKKFRALKPDVVWCDNVRTFFTLYVACKIVRAKVVWNIWSEPKGKVAWLLHRLGLFLADEINLEYADQARVVFGKWANIGFFKRKITPIYTGVTDFDPSTDSDIRAELSLLSEDILITMASNIVPGKGQLDLVKALEILAKDFPNLHLLIAGTPVDGHAASLNYHETLKEYALREHISGQVHLLGWRSDIRDILQTSDIYVSTSYSESFPDSVREAMLVSKPVVVTDVGGTFELVNVGKNGYLFEPGDVGALVAHLRKIIVDSELRLEMGVESKRIIDERFSTEVYVQNFEKMVLDLV
jgi:glycosyltransferase involved in cell wall biosynthesis